MRPMAAVQRLAFPSGPRCARRCSDRMASTRPSRRVNGFYSQGTKPYRAERADDTILTVRSRLSRQLVGQSGPATVVRANSAPDALSRSLKIAPGAVH